MPDLGLFDTPRDQSWDHLRQVLGAGRTPVARIFNAGAEQSPEASMDFLPAAAGPAPRGWIPTNPQWDVGFSGARAPTPQNLALQQSRDASDNFGSALNAARTQSQLVAASGMNGPEQAAMRNAIIGRHNLNIDLQNEQQNAGRGLFTVPRAEVVGRYGPIPGQTGGGVLGMGAQTDRINADTNAKANRERTVGAIIAQGGLPDEAAEAGRAFDNAMRTGAPPQAVNAAAGGTPPLTATPTALQRILDRHLQTAASLPSQEGSGPRMPVLVPATLTGEPANRAITNFVHSASSAGLMTPENMPAVMAYMVQKFGSNRVDPWFRARMGATEDPQTAAIQTIINRANAANQARNPNTTDIVSVRGAPIVGALADRLTNPLRTRPPRPLPESRDTPVTSFVRRLYSAIGL